ncbi:MAG: hypothetical protein K940chlam3_01489 [Chlamydiae bacterium]|nr:hypothetical protein [Chlamydiota bacterium]
MILILILSYEQNGIQLREILRSPSQVLKTLEKNPEEGSSK